MKGLKEIGVAAGVTLASLVGCSAHKPARVESEQWMEYATQPSAKECSARPSDVEQGKVLTIPQARVVRYEKEYHYEGRADLESQSITRITSEGTWFFFDKGVNSRLDRVLYDPFKDTGRKIDLLGRAECEVFNNEYEEIVATELALHYATLQDIVRKGEFRLARSKAPLMRGKVAPYVVIAEDETRKYAIEEIVVPTKYNHIVNYKVTVSDNSVLGTPAIAGNWIEVKERRKKSRIARRLLKRLVPVTFDY